MRKRNGLGALLIVILNDMSKKNSVKNARAQNKSSNVNMHHNKTQWGLVAAVTIGICGYAFLLNNPEMMKEIREGDWGLLTPIVKHFLEEPPHMLD